MSHLLSPAQRIAGHVDPATMAGTDPYALGFCVMSYDASESREVASYGLGDGYVAFISYSIRFGFAVVVRDAGGQEILAARVADEEEIRTVLAPYIR
jgi:tetrahydromethanopterin S-methyltransferase subunit C